MPSITGGVRRNSSGRPSTTRARRSVLDTSRWGTSTWTQSKPPGRSATKPGPVDHDERRALGDLAVALPREESGRGVLAEDREQLGAGVPLGEVGQRVGGVGDAAPVELDARGLEPLDVTDGLLDQPQPVPGRCDGPAGFLLPRHVGDHEQHAVEVQAVADVDRRDEMAYVRGIKRAAEHSETFGHSRESRRPPVTPGGHPAALLATLARDPARGAPSQGLQRRREHEARRRPRRQPVGAAGPRLGQGRAPGRGAAVPPDRGEQRPSPRWPFLGGQRQHIDAVARHTCLRPGYVALPGEVFRRGARRPARPACRPRPGRERRRSCPCGCRRRRRRWARRPTPEHATRCSSRSPEARICTSA